jgi:hypothetical protein
VPAWRLAPAMLPSLPPLLLLLLLLLVLEAC